MYFRCESSTVFLKTNYYSVVPLVQALSLVTLSMLQCSDTSAYCVAVDNKSLKGNTPERGPIAGVMSDSPSSLSYSSSTTSIQQRASIFSLKVFSAQDEIPSSPAHHQVRAFEVPIHTSKDSGRFLAIISSLLVAPWIPQLLHSR